MTIGARVTDRGDCGHRIRLAPHNSSVWAVSFGGRAYGPQPRALYAGTVYNIGHLGHAH